MHKGIVGVPVLWCCACVFGGPPSPLGVGFCAGGGHTVHVCIYDCIVWGMRITADSREDAAEAAGIYMGQGEGRQRSKAAPTLLVRDALLLLVLLTTQDSSQATELPRRAVQTKQ